MQGYLWLPADLGGRSEERPTPQRIVGLVGHLLSHPRATPPDSRTLDETIGRRFDQRAGYLGLSTARGDAGGGDEAYLLV